MSRRHEPPPHMATLVNMGAVLGQGMLILNVTQASAKPWRGKPDYSRGGSKGRKSLNLKWLILLRLANRKLQLARRSDDYSLLTKRVIN